MRTPTPVVSVSPRVGVLLTKIAETPDLETALWKVITEDPISATPDPEI